MPLPPCFFRVFSLVFFVFCGGKGGQGGGGVPKLPYSHFHWHSINVSRGKMWRRPDRVNARLEHTREILRTAETQARNNDQRRSLTDLRKWSRTPTLVMYRLQSQPSLLRIVLWSAYLEAFFRLASVSHGQFSSTKVILCLPCTDRSRMTRSGLSTCTMMSAGIDLPPGAYSPSKSQYGSNVLLPTRADFRQPAM
jgi:hypothetical protein